MKPAVVRKSLNFASVLCAAVCLGGAIGLPTAGASPGDHHRTRASSNAETAVKAAKAQLKKYAHSPKFVAPHAPFNARKLRGKVVAVVAYDESAGALLQNVQGVKAAASQVGIHVTNFNAKYNPSLMSEGVEQAVTSHAAAIIMVGLPVPYVAAALKKAKAAHIPVIAADDYPPLPRATVPKPATGIYSSVTFTLELQGELAADVAIVHWKGHAKALIIDTPGLTQGPAIIDGYKKALARCKTCSVLHTSQIQIQTWTTGLGPLTTSLLQSFPQANTILPLFNDMSLFIAPAIKSGGNLGKVAVLSANSADVQLVPSYPTVLVGFVGGNTIWLGWQALDEAMRGMLGLKPGRPVVSATRYLTPATISKVGTTINDLFGSSYEAGFKKLWKS